MKQFEILLLYWKKNFDVLFSFSLCSGFFVCVIFLDIFFNDDSVTISITT